jgi:dolichol-phosphate mannosyltransferase
MAKTGNRSSARSNSGPSVAVVIPCYRERLHILELLNAIGPEASAIYVVDDACPDNTGILVEESCTDKRVQVLRHDTNLGVGGATLTGYRAALEAGFDIIVKLDGDGQMAPDQIPRIIAPLIDGRADYTKGNRFHRADAIAAMPRTRIAGNFALSLMSKLSSGYWNIFDPTNGYTAIHKAAASSLQMDKLSKGYFFESDLLFQLGIIRAVVEDVPMIARYGAETSGINIPKVIPEFFAKHYVNTCKRIYFNYFLRDPGVATLQLVFGKLLTAFGVIFGGWHWYHGAQSGVTASAGTVVLAALPILIGLQFLRSFFGQDVDNIPRQPLQSLALPPDNINPENN